MTAPEKKQGKLIEAGGAVLWRRRGTEIEIALVHRPRYDDWSHPKGKKSKIDGDLLECARREVAEETGFSVETGAHIGTIEYEVVTKKGRPADKLVEYWAMEATDGKFEANREVDEIRWLVPAEAADLLTYGRDRAILAAALESIAP